MELNEIITAISTVGFPIFACCAMGLGFYKLNEMHREEAADLRDALERNTEAIVKLSAIIDDRRD